MYLINRRGGSSRCPQAQRWCPPIQCLMTTCGLVFATMSLHLCSLPQYCGRVWPGTARTAPSPEAELQIVTPPPSVQKDSSSSPRRTEELLSSLFGVALLPELLQNRSRGAGNMPRMFFCSKLVVLTEVWGT